MGSDAVAPEKDQNHPLMPDEVIYAGHRTPVNYQAHGRCAAAPELPPQRRGTGAGDAGTGSLKSPAHKKAPSMTDGAFLLLEAA